MVTRRHRSDGRIGIFCVPFFTHFAPFRHAYHFALSCGYTARARHYRCGAYLAAPLFADRACCVFEHRRCTAWLTLSMLARRSDEEQRK